MAAGRERRPIEIPGSPPSWDCRRWPTGWAWVAPPGGTRPESPAAPVEPRIGAGREYPDTLAAAPTETARRPARRTATAPGKAGRKSDMARALSGKDPSGR